MFTGFSDATIDFLWELRFHNERPWFLEHKQVFLDTLDQPMKALAADVTAALEQAYPDRKWYLHVARIYRDARITSIYEGTTQLQTVAAIRYVTNGSYIATIREFEAIPCSPEMEPLMSRLKKMADKFEASTNAVKEVQDQELLDFTARKLVEMAADIIMCHLLIQDASKSSELFSKSAHVYLNYAEAEVEKHTNFIENFDKEDLAFYKK